MIPGKNVLTMIIVLGLQFYVPQLFAEDWSFLNTKRTGASQFIKNNPDYNGKEAVIIILDTGIDMGTAGLSNLPGGGIKVIDAQDFSSEGDIELEEAEKSSENNESCLIHPHGLKLFGYDKLNIRPVDSLYYIGILEEEQFKNTIIPDINNNGKENDRFGLIVFQADYGWLAYVDLDGDGNLDDEQPRRNYKDDLESLQFRGRDTKHDQKLASFALNIFADENRVNFHYDGSSHGTHVAGIAAGYSINGQKGLNGIAPGAKIISLKIGDCRLAGGATTTGSMLEAYEYGIEFAKKYDGPVVFNMSFGVGSEIEGLADMDLMLDDLSAENESLLFVTSAGNEGPGISTVGLPAAAKRVLSVGALNTKESARDVYSANLKKDKIFVFSARGGEINKPDILAPGSASSTVPPFSTRENKWGTSMASPQAAGAVALIMSASVQQNPRLVINGALIKKAVKNAARPLPDYLPLEQGRGVIDIPKSFEYYKEYIKNKEYEQVLDYETSTLSPVYESERGRASYWRFGTYVPDSKHKQRFYISPVFPSAKTVEEKHNFYRAFNLVPTESWIKLNKSSTYIRGEKSAIVEVYFDKDKLTNPGVYNGRIIAYRKGGVFSGNDAKNIEFELMCTAIVPVIFSVENNYHWDSPEIKLEKGDVHRIFFDIPVGASSTSIRLGRVDSQYGKVRGYLFDPKGREHKRSLILDTEKQSAHIIRLNSSDLIPGTWELDLYAYFQNEQTSQADVKISFSGLDIIPATITSVKIRNGYNPKGLFRVINRFTDLIETQLSGSIYGVSRTQYIDDYSDKYEYTFKVDDDCEKIEFTLELKPQVYNMFTDFAINVTDYKENILLADGLSYRKTTFTFIPPQSGTFTLQLLPGFAGKEPKNWQANLKEDYYKFKKSPISGGAYNFYPKVNKEVEFEIEGTLPVAPDGFHVFGEIWLDSHDIHKQRIVIPVKLYTSFNN